VRGCDWDGGCWGTGSRARVAVKNIRIATAVTNRYLDILGVFLSSWLEGQAAVVKRNKVAKRFYHIEFMNR
jgi:hypothetical protein